MLIKILIYDLEFYTSMFKLKGKSLYVKLALNVCLTAAAGNRAESVYCKTYTISGLSASGAGNSI